MLIDIKGSKLYFAGESLTDPDFDLAEKINDWRNYIGEETRKLWPTFNIQQLKALVIDAQDLADREVDSDF